MKYIHQIVGLILFILIITSCKSLYPGNCSKYGGYFYKKAILQKTADSLYAADSKNKCLVAKIKGKWVLICK
jgi:hypothetical protein